MKTISLLQPWASLVAIGAKKIETRSWSTQYRGPIAIHASAGFGNANKALYWQSPFYEAFCAHYGANRCYDSGCSILPRGAILATATLVDVLPTESIICLPGVFDDYPDLDTPNERAFGDYTEGRFGWIIENVKLLPEPVAAKGKLNLWEWTPDVTTNESPEAGDGLPGERIIRKRGGA